ncbi:hypothetical protein A2690_01715 [Candidatus Roizmanbacteria bacterium RIFCSPHIGHO2_01_FULL_39_12b]|uniref:Peptidase S9 prolyl oligopeptidase catalytic domain-containing protein n=1 Tax=Candidatus Roizmanbacteria bacterium RIFCSPHIGHO2_01_FULL_39_12b TaxID=1802030 RepID=A0A1F7GBH4_9BACT|nr:MAG: hypothetical protein A2690_01715 [Candidatus Roizmanbacteria bacterium RIFCSPHIGHO2_01_FULL_39_12b]OGK46138.1 MAG: hypothetical protein A3B46_02960 [Candidatus Roizmanbacteria bacterium RIFCSPLOWO2_01_FULL_39_19]
MLIYGTEDEYTEPQEVKKIFASIPESKMIHKLHCEHDYRYHADAIDEVDKVLGSFVNKYFE